MSFKYFLLVSILALAVAGRAHLSRSANQEMERLKENRIETPKVNLDEYWPFPQAISDANPSLFELEQQLLRPGILSNTQHLN